MGAGDRTQLAVIVQAGIGNKFAPVVFVGAPGFGIGEIGEPFLFGRHIGGAFELGACQRLFGDRNQVHFRP